MVKIRASESRKQKIVDTGCRSGVSEHIVGLYFARDSLSPSQRRAHAGICQAVLRYVSNFPMPSAISWWCQADRHSVCVRGVQAS
uniref:Uncharacterized protein n=1 Tax=Tanacetum cinerariifolium TaxID=118510 RepID=A0A699WQ22_TANCI|nr:hypothetical protein [Tanacetum cinerariifolium]